MHIVFCAFIIAFAIFMSAFYIPWVCEKKRGQLMENSNSKLNYTNDTVKVVRCKDCKFYKTPWCSVDLWTENVRLFKVRDYDYCSFGERKVEYEE